ncbi:MAG: hypothetical protein CBB68_06420 [Rhodospirillaceae bacterium TMED8]|nr:hypothetical protein [Magnetovibrio sp.]OUT51250.1 MAG: hypothetical protein CBB68_06420 [Rhodospirillaceae bacterium TMED8]|tara:strand:- start:219 stop:1199 length:981 start_codon:yes stop_codon:yes gene_type:complete
MKKDKIVVLMATYNDWESVAELVPKIDNELVKNDLSGHIVIVDDGSTDVTGRTKLLDAQLSSINHIECLELYRNQGNQRANAVGIAYCNDTVVGDYLILMDSDQEDKPKYIPELIKACASYDDRQIVFAERSERSEGWQFKFFYAIYQKLYNILTGMKISIGNFSAIPYVLLARVAHISELWSHYPAAIMRAKLPFSTICSDRGKRTLGISKMSTVPLLLHALSGFAVHAEIIGARILVTAGVFGIITLCVVIGLVAIRLFTDLPILGWTSQIIGMLIIIIFQILITAGIMVFLIIAGRMQPAIAPAQVYSNFIMKKLTLLCRNVS